MLPIELVRGSFYFKNLISMEKEKSIMCILREMEIDDKKDFPISKRAYLLNLTSYRLKEKEPDKKWVLSLIGTAVLSRSRELSK